MKNLGKLLVVALVMVFIVSCDDKENPSEVNVKKELISAKWNLSSTSDYVSIEFNMDGNYIAVKNTILKSTSSQNVLFGTYEIVDNTTINLSGLGVLKIIEISDNSISFTINNSETVNATKQEEVETSSNTELLCRTWEVVSIADEEITDFIVLFSKAGTYLVDAIIEDMNEDGSITGSNRVTALGKWRWCNSEENKLAFTIGNELNCDGREIFKEIQLTKKSFIGIDMENGESQTFIMKAD